MQGADPRRGWRGRRHGWHRAQRHRAQARRGVLLRSNAELEARVAERTEELARANAKLLADLQALEAAERTHRRLVAILEATTDFVSIAAPDSRLLYVNVAGRRMVGLGPTDDISGLRIADFHSPAIARLGGRGGDAGGRARRRVGRRITLRARDGREIPVSQVLLSRIAMRRAARVLSRRSCAMSARCAASSSSCSRRRSSRPSAGSRAGWRTTSIIF